MVRARPITKTYVMLESGRMLAPLNEFLRPKCAFDYYKMLTENRNL